MAKRKKARKARTGGRKEGARSEKNAPAHSRSTTKGAATEVWGAFSLRYAGVAAVVLAGLLYCGIFNHGFVYWDDQPMIEKAWQHPLSFSSLGKIFTTFYGTYQPLRDLSYSFDARVFGKRLWGFLLHNVLLYCLNVWLVFWVCLGLFRFARPGPSPGPDLGAPGAPSPEGGVFSGPVLPAFLAAVLFAVHPIHVEAVAWLAARKEVLLGLFFLLSVWCFMKMDTAAERKERLIWLAASFASYVFALLSKPSAAALPLVLLAYDLILVRPKRREWKRRVWIHLPFWVPAFSAVIYFAVFAGTTQTALAAEDVLHRLVAMNVILAHSFWILVVPVHLSARYAFEPNPSFTDPSVLVGAGLQILLIGAFVLCLRRNRLVSFLIAWFYINFLPTSGLIPIAIQSADRYLYLPSLAFCAFVSLILMEKAGRAFARRFPGIRKAALATMGALVVVYGVLTVHQTGYWRDDLTLWTHTAELTPTDLAFYSLGEAYRRRDDLVAAERCYRQSLEINPRFTKALNGLGNLMLMKGRVREAEALYQRAVKADPDYPTAHRHLAIVYVTFKDYDRALKHAEKALKLGLGADPVLLDLLSRLYLWKKDWYKLLRTAYLLSRVEPDGVRAQIYLERAYDRLGNSKAARKHRARAYQLDARKARELEEMTLMR